MTSWRETASEAAQRDLDALLNFALGFAQRELQDRGEFFPYAAFIETGGSAQMLAARPASGGEHPRTTDVLDACVASLQARRATLRAAAIVMNVHLKQPRDDAIEVDLEHVEGLALTVILPYARERSRGAIRYGTASAEQGPRRVWRIV